MSGRFDGGRFDGGRVDLGPGRWRAGRWPARGARVDEHPAAGRTAGFGAGTGLRSGPARRAVREPSAQARALDSRAGQMLHFMTEHVVRTARLPSMWLVCALIILLTVGFVLPCMLDIT